MTPGTSVKSVFESFVNLEGCKTKTRKQWANTPFESFVNLEGCKTLPLSVVS